MIFVDVECFSNYFLVVFKRLEDGKTIFFELSEECQNIELTKLDNIMSNFVTVGFNSNYYDIPMLIALQNSFTYTKLKKISDDLILSGEIYFKILQKYNLENKNNWNHIDIFNLPIGKASLKTYGGRIHFSKLQDLPFEPDTPLTQEQMLIVKNYCINDIDTTIALYNELKPQIDLRLEMTNIYKVDMRSKSDAQIAEAIIKKQFPNTKAKYYKKDYSFKYKLPDFIKLKNNELINKIINYNFTLNEKGSVVCPEFLLKEKVNINNKFYKMGIGGLHSCEEKQFIKSHNDYLISDFDVSSYYPTIILQQQLYPKALGEKFVGLYQNLVDKRLIAKKNNNKTMAEVLKIAVNGSFGKFGNKYSILYAPELLIQTTITGQLALLMLIEQLESENITVISANTDGIVCYYHKDQKEFLEDVLFSWMLATQFNLEQTDYQFIASRDVNNYVALKTDGKVKTKGIFAKDSLAKNPDCSIVYQAVTNFLIKGVPIENTIMDGNDIRNYVRLRRVTGGATFRGDYLGRVIRFYYSNSVTPDDYIFYAKNNNKVALSQGAMPIMNLPDDFPSDINYDYYVKMAYKLLKEAGYV